VEGLELIIDDLVGSSGLELKVDPGIPYVYAGFGGNVLPHLGTLFCRVAAWWHVGYP